MPRARRRGAPPRWCRGRAPCHRSAACVGRAARRTASRRCARAWRRRAAPGRPPAPRRRRRGRRGRGRAARTGAPVSSANRAAPSAWSAWPWVSSVGGHPQPRGRRRRRARPPGAARRAARGRPRRTRCDPGSSSTQVLVPSRVIGPGLGASTQVARAVTLRRASSPPAAGDRRGPVGGRTRGPSGRRRSPGQLAARMTTSCRRPGPSSGCDRARPGPARRRSRRREVARGHLLDAHDGRRQHQRRARPPGPAAARPGRTQSAWSASVVRSSARWPGGHQRARRTGCRSGGARTPG